MDRVGDDHRIGPTHISLFLAILYFYRKQESEQTPKEEVKKNQTLKPEKEVPVKKQTRKHKIQ